MPELNKVRVRFAPSPTGHLHVGNARTALFNWLYARQQGGAMILRMEDTDLERSEARHEQQIFDDLKWLGIDWDEGPDVGGPYASYRQSERLELYREQAERLLRYGKAYLCFCTAEELERERQRAVAEHRPQIYSGKCRQLDAVEAAKRRNAGQAAAIRLKIPEHAIRFRDLVHGEVEFQHEAVSDPIIVRSTGIPVYNYVVVVDDVLMKITHVIRGDDHLSNTPKQVALYEALGEAPPEFAHLSTILGSDRERLSKRHGATSIANFREMGVLPEALVNYLALLGWAPHGGDREIFSRGELLKEFDLRRVTPSPAIFDFDKLYWLNRHYIKEHLASGVHRFIDIGSMGKAELARLTGFSSEVIDRIEELAELTANLKGDAWILFWSFVWLQKAGMLPLPFNGTTFPWFSRLVEIFAPSVDRLNELPERAAMIFKYDAAAALAAPDNAETLGWPKTHAVIEAFAKRALAEPGHGMTAERFKAIMNEVKAETGAKGKELFHPVRVMLTGSHSGPEFDKLIPLLEEGSKLPLPKKVQSVRERVEEFMAARKN